MWVDVQGDWLMCYAMGADGGWDEDPSAVEFTCQDMLDRVNHLASIAGFLGLTLGVALAGAYSVAYRTVVMPQIVWGMGAWVCISALALGRILRGLQARRAALLSAITFASVVALYIVFRVTALNRGQFL